MAERGAAVVTSIYTWAWSQLAVNEQDPLSDWTRQYLYTFNLNLDYRIEKYIELAKRYKLDGFLFHSNRSCKWISQDVIALRDSITELTGIPGVIFEADQNDPRLYSFENLERQIDSFIDLLAVRNNKV